MSKLPTWAQWAGSLIGTIILVPVYIIALTALAARLCLHEQILILRRMVKGSANE